MTVKFLFFCNAWNCFSFISVENPFSVNSQRAEYCAFADCFADWLFASMYTRNFSWPTLFVELSSLPKVAALAGLINDPAINRLNNVLFTFFIFLTPFQSIFGLHIEFITLLVF